MRGAKAVCGRNGGFGLLRRLGQQVDPDAVVTYRYAEGPGSFTGAARRGFITWLIGSLRRPERSAPANRDQRSGRPNRARRKTSELFVVPGEEDDSAGLSSGS